MELLAVKRVRGVIKGGVAKFKKILQCQKNDTWTDRPGAFRRIFPLVRNMLCFWCLSLGHVSKFCPKKDICSKCGKEHPTALHDFQFKFMTNKDVDAPAQIQRSPPAEEMSDAGTCQKVCAEKLNQMTSMIVPMWLSNRNDSTRGILVYALLDAQSDTTFVTEQVADSLGTPYIDAVLRLTTMNAPE